MLLEDLMDIVENHNSLGWSVQEQLQSVFAAWSHDCLDEVIEEQNTNALRMIRDWLRSANRSLEGDSANEIAGAIDRFLDGLSGEGEGDEEE